jgi:hypothetical protein
VEELVLVRDELYHRVLGGVFRAALRQGAATGPPGDATFSTRTLTTDPLRYDTSEECRGLTDGP